VEKRPPGGIDVVYHQGAETTSPSRWLASMDTSAFQGRVVLSLVAIIAIVLLRRGILKVIDLRLEDPKARYRWGKFSAYAASLVVLLIIGQIWVEGLRAVGTFLGLVAVGIAIGLRDLIADLAGWCFIIWRQTFKVGDRVQVGEDAGDVVDVGLLHFTLLEIGNWVDADQSTGRVIHVPNGAVLSKPVANYTSNFEYLWHEIPVRITLESDWRKAKEILEEIVRERMGRIGEEAANALEKLSRNHLISYKAVTPAVYTTVKEGAVSLSLRFLCPSRARRGTSQEIWEAILDRFSEEDTIQFAYPTRRIFARHTEGRTLRAGPRDAVNEGGQPWSSDTTS
jgi:small-conductance mechanosensitive channel